jgi:hypothetical protein
MTDGITEAAKLEVHGRDDDRIERLEKQIAQMAAQLAVNDERTALAVQISLGSVEAIRHMQAAAEHGHAKEGESLAAQKKIIIMFEAAAKSALQGAPAAKPPPSR